MPDDPVERQAALLTALRARASMTVVEAWEFGHDRGFYVGGDALKAKDDLMALCQRNQARRHDGFWRHINEPDRIRLRHKRWADYWTAVRSRGSN